MSITTCPSCQKKLRAAGASRKVRCPKCRTEFIVPVAATGPSPARPEAQGTPSEKRSVAAGAGHLPDDSPSGPKRFRGMDNEEPPPAATQETSPLGVASLF